MEQVREGCAEAGVLLGGENALPCFAPGGVNAQGLDRIVYNTKALDPPLQVSPLPIMHIPPRFHCQHLARADMVHSHTVRLMPEQRRPAACALAFKGPGGARAEKLWCLLVAPLLWQRL